MAKKRELGTYFISILLTFLIVRLHLYFFPNTNLNILGYNVHHIFIGALILVIIAILALCDIKNVFIFFIGGMGISLVLDELIFIILTNGSNQAYASPISLISSVILHVITLLILGFAYYKNKKQK